VSEDNVESRQAGFTSAGESVPDHVERVLDVGIVDRLVRGGGWVPVPDPPRRTDRPMLERRKAGKLG
jgi:hypothetical protein